MKKVILGIEKTWMAVLFGIMGVMLILFPETFTDAIPYMLGIGSIVRGIVGIVAARRYKEEADVKAGDIVVDIVFGGAILYHNAEAIGAIGAIWAMLSLYEVAEEITEAFANRHFPFIGLIFSAITIVLAVMLLFAPVEHFVLHVRILGLEMLSTLFAREHHLRRRRKTGEE